MDKRAFLAIFAVAIVVVSGIGYMVLTDNSGTSSEPEYIQEVKNTSSYQKLASRQDPEIEAYNITQSTVEYSRNHDYPYDSDRDVEQPRDIFTLAVDFGNFSETESRLVLVNTSAGRIYQLNDENEIINRIGTTTLAIRMDMEEERRKMCRNVDIGFTARQSDEYEFREESLPKIQISNSGSEIYEGRIILELDMIEGENVSRRKYDLGPGAIYNFEFNDVESFEEIEKAVLLPEECPEEEKVVTDFSSE